MSTCKKLFILDNPMIYYGYSHLVGSWSRSIFLPLRFSKWHFSFSVESLSDLSVFVFESFCLFDIWKNDSVPLMSQECLMHPIQAGPIHFASLMERISIMTICCKKTRRNYFNRNK